MAYDTQGNLTSRTITGAESGGAFSYTTLTGYNSGGQPTSVDPPGYGSTDVTTYAGRLVTIERKPDALTHGERTFYTLDAVGHRTREEFQHWSGSVWVTDAKTDYVYSSRCHLDKTIRQDGSASGAVTEYAYDCDDNLAQVWDAKHPSNNQANPSTQAYQYDDLNRLATVTQPWAGAGGGTSVTHYAYDVQDHLILVTDANGNMTSYVYSDRDLMTRQVSPVSGQTDSNYNEHGELVSETDARAITMSRTADALDRVTAMSYPDTSLNVTYQYDTGPLAKGRLTGITRYGETIAYGYDRFGRLTQDGALGYLYDANGNRTSIGYPGGSTASYTFDFADREQSLTLQVGTNPPLALAGPASYKPFGPLAGLPLGNGLTETRTFDGRYLPASIQLAGATSTLLNWSYALDPVGNITGITDVLNSANNRTYGYLDVNYFLTRGDGPWGTRSWIYDRIGDRLTETRSGVTDTYTYLANGAAQTPKLGSIALGGGGTRIYSYDADGNTIQIVDPTQQLDLLPDAANRLAGLRSVPSRSRADMTYDGRGFLRRANDDGGGACIPTLTVPTYSSEGRLERRAHFSLFAPAGPPDDTTLVLYFAGRPVVLYRQTTAASSLNFLTTDHLGTPIAATSDTGTLTWQGGFEPFGADWNDAPSSGIFLGLPGQWLDSVWGNVATPAAPYYNLHRWYDPARGRYDRPDPLGANDSSRNLFAYAKSNPVIYRDIDGLDAQICCRLLANVIFGTMVRQRHCYVKANDGTRYGLYPERSPRGQVGIPRTNDDRDQGGICRNCECRQGSDAARQDACFQDHFDGYPYGEYNAALGPNSNTFAGTLARGCCKKVPGDLGSAPGFDQSPPLPVISH